MEYEASRGSIKFLHRLSSDKNKNEVGENDRPAENFREEYKEIHRVKGERIISKEITRAVVFITRITLR